MAPGPADIDAERQRRNNASNGGQPFRHQRPCMRSSCFSRSAAISTGNSSKVVENCSLNQASQAITTVLL